MTWWQLLIAAYWVGAFASMPACFEHAAYGDEELDEPMPWWVVTVLVVFMALAWPGAWVSLIRYALRTLPKGAR